MRLRSIIPVTAVIVGTVLAPVGMSGFAQPSAFGSSLPSDQSITVDPTTPFTEAPASSASPTTNAPTSHSAASLNGAGSSFAGPEVSQWTSDTAKPPYNLNVNYNSSSSSDGRFEFANNTVDYAVSDIPYQPAPFDTKSPGFPYIYIPVTAGGLAFMYHLGGLSGNLQLSSQSACGIFTGLITTWNDPMIKADNPGLSLPATAIHAVTRTDLAGTNFVFQEFCINQQPQMWAAFVTSPTVRGIPNQVNDLSATQPRSDWPLFPTAIGVDGSANAANTVENANNNGYITAVETAYAIQRNMPVAKVKNASGNYTLPTSVDVDSALAYATQQPDGTHVLNFAGQGPLVYNPSTYSYLIVPTTNWDPTKGASMSQFINYSLTIGQTKANEIGYAGLGLSLEQYGINAAKANIPGYSTPTADEAAAFACGDFTPAEVQAGATTPTCGVTNATATTPQGGGVNAGAQGNGGVSGGGGGGTGSGGGIDASVSLTDPGVSTSGNPALSFTGGNPEPFVVIGLFMIAVGWLGRRKFFGRNVVALSPQTSRMEVESWT